MCTLHASRCPWLCHATVVLTNLLYLGQIRVRRSPDRILNALNKDQEGGQDEWAQEIHCDILDKVPDQVDGCVVKPHNQSDYTPLLRNCPSYLVQCQWYYSCGHFFNVLIKIINLSSSTNIVCNYQHWPKLCWNDLNGLFAFCWADTRTLNTVFLLVAQFWYHIYHEWYNDRYFKINKTYNTDTDSHCLNSDNNVKSFSFRISLALQNKICIFIVFQSLLLNINQSFSSIFPIVLEKNTPYTESLFIAAVEDYSLQVYR